MEKIYQLVQDQFNKMVATGKLFRSSIPGSEIWSLYLSGFAKKEIFRDPESSVHNCNTCHSFFKRYSNVVAISEDLKVMSLFDCYELVPEEYRNSFMILSKKLKKAAIKDTFIETLDNLRVFSYGGSTKPRQETYRLGIQENVKVYTQEEAAKFGVVTPGVAYKFQHYSLLIPGSFISNSSESVEALSAITRTSKELLKRALDEIPVDTLELVVDLINQGSLLDGTTHLHKVEAMIPLAREYQDLPKSKEDNWCWIKSSDFKYSRFRNELIGVLCTELAQGKELNKACEDWNKRVDPSNYMKATAPITQRQINEAMKFAQENGYEASFIRRCAVLDDIKVSDILHANSGDGKIQPVSVFSGLKPTTTRHKRSEFSGISEVPIEKFMKDILPGCQSVEVFLTSGHSRNFVTLTTPVDNDSKPIFKWNNNFSWTYNGNLAGKSQIKEAVKNAGGFVDAPFRFSILWNDEDTPGILDFDAHCTDASGFDIYYGSKYSYHTGGQLDIDMINPVGKGVENIFWKNLGTLKDGKYKFYIHNYNGGDNRGIKAEIYFNGVTYNYWIKTRVKGYVDIATVTIKNHEVIDIKHSDYLIDSIDAQENVWGLDTNQFHKVNLVCLSPNYWGSNIGNKHYFFMLEGCKAPGKIRGFHNENLIPELLKHRKVMEVLGAKLMIDSTPGQLSGLGFNATVKDSVIVRLKGSHNRVIKLIF